MKLLFDQNLSPRLPRALADIYPESVHVREIGLRDATDTEIWEYAKTNDFVIVSKDSDFQSRTLLYGGPPKFIWLRVGNSGQANRRFTSESLRANPYVCPRQGAISFDVAVKSTGHRHLYRIVAL